MAAFASCRRSGWVRVLVVILCAFFIFATLGAPPAQALGVESVAVFGLASVLSAATAALGFKLASNEQGQATLQKMVQDFKTVAWATGFVLVGSKLNGLQNGMDYIKMQVKNGKTYLDSRVFAWVQQWLAANGVYNAGSFVPSDSVSLGIKASDIVSLSAIDTISQAESYFSLPWQKTQLRYMRNYVKTGALSNSTCFSVVQIDNRMYLTWQSLQDSNVLLKSAYPGTLADFYMNGQSYNYDYYNTNFSDYLWPGGYHVVNFGGSECTYFSGFGSVSSNDTGLSGTDTLGKDVIDLTIDQILERLKEWAQDWFDAGADSATNAATGAQDLPLTVATGAATANPSIAEDGPLVWFPSFGLPIPSLRTGETDTKTVDQGKENASAAETSTVDVAENQSVLDSLVNWALGYISPDTGIFSKFPLCVPYDAYLLVTSSLGVDSVGSDSIFGASPGDLDGVVTEGIETYSDFQPIINIKHDFELDGVTYPLELVIDLRPWQPLVTFFREGMALLLVAELIGAEYKRIRWH